MRALLHAWSKKKNESDWVLGTIYDTEGSTYRKAGAMMLFNGFGQQFGLLSGGCLDGNFVISVLQILLSLIRDLINLILNSMLIKYSYFSPLIN